MIFAKDSRTRTNINVLVLPGVLIFLVRKLSFAIKSGLGGRDVLQFKQYFMVFQALS